MKAILLIGAMLALAGCIPDKGAELASCKVDAMQRFKSTYGDGYDYVVDCMRSKGYVLDAKSCPAAGALGTSRFREEDCYHYWLVS